jgi:ferric-dicitrate binding protein FerR (iron transport regulator)
VKNNRENIGDDVLVKYLLGEADADEVRAVQLWIADSAANRKYFDDFKLIWDESKKLEGQTTISTEDAWSRFKSRISQEEVSGVGSGTQGSRTIALGSMAWMRAAAVLVLLVGGGWLIYTMSGSGDGQMLAQSFDKVLMHTLPDGSVVTLNKHSELSYPAHFDGKTRSVSLKGEAFFDVKPDKTKPFIIETDNSSVTVVGTSFNVKNRKDMTEVIVETGIVKVAGKTKAVELKPGQKVTVAGPNDALQQEQISDELYNYYRTNEFVCNAIPLHKVVAALNEAYNADVVIADPKLNSLLLTTTFKNDTLDNILQVIAKTFNFTIEKEGNRIILK